MNPAVASTDDAYRWWYSLINYEQRVPAADDLKLDHLRALLALLGDPQRSLRIVHVAGSKGKGSTAAMLAAIFRAAGLRTGLFTSPHLVHVEERIQIDGRPIATSDLAALLREIRGHAELRTAHSDRVPLTFFEVATAAGFLHFARQRVDVAVIEVGLGGRFDSTNVCTPALAIVTSISHDHTKILGERLEQIAMEKAGIFKPGRPAVSGVTVAEPRAVVEQIAAERGCPLRQLARDFHFTAVPGAVTARAIVRPRLQVTTTARAWPEMETNLLGTHQAANAAVAVAAIEELRRQGWNVADAAVAEGLATVQWPARLEVVGRQPFVVLDCAHNVASALALVETLRESFPAKRRLLVFAGSSDKDLAGMFRALAPHFAHAYLTRYSASSRAVAPEQLADLLRAAGPLPCTLCASPAEAWQAARAAAAADDLICITGSVFLAGELRPLLGVTARQPAS